MLPIVLKEYVKALINPCMVLGMLPRSVFEGILDFMGMLVCSENGVSFCVIDGFGVMVFLLVGVCVDMALLDALMVAILTEDQVLNSSHYTGSGCPKSYMGMDIGF